MRWLTNWLIIRGCNTLYPHAFYYSVRGPRIDERPPDVGPNSAWWDSYKPYADSCSRLCWLNTDSRHVCSLAILGRNDYLPWRSAKVCFQNQRDFNYIEARHLWEDAEVSADGIRIGKMHYRALIVEDDPPKQAESAMKTLDKAGRLIRWTKAMTDSDLVGLVDKLVPVDVSVSPDSPDLRVRHVIKNGMDCYLLFNEGQQDITVKLDLSTKGPRFLIDAQTGRRIKFKQDAVIGLLRHEMKLLVISAS
jgi:hypothetical protein